jgi:DNA invertase Pin-like site-specific DNA recombinase
MVSETPRIRAALYFRQSLDVQEGIDRQRARCTSLATARDWDVVGEYVDNDTSASKSRADGTAWARLLEDARARKFEIVIAVDLDRLLRTINDLVTLTETGAKVLTVDGEIDLTTADGEFRATMLAGIARFEARRKGERQLRANEHAAAQGRRTGGRRPFGYEPDGVTVRPAEAAAVAEGYRDFLTGVPLAAIARDWKARGFHSGVTRYSKAHRGQPSDWTAGGVRTVLLNPRNMGKRAHRGEIVADAEWPAIVDESTWLAVNAVLTDPSRRAAPKRGRYLLSGLALCGVCRARIHAGGNATAGEPGYRCSGSAGHFARRSAPVDEFVQAVMVGRLSRPDALELLKSEPTSEGPDLALEAVGARSRLDSLAVEFADGGITASQLRIATERLVSRLAELEAQMADLGRADVLGPLVGAEDVQVAWDALSIEKKRAVIAVLATVVVYPPGRGVRKFDPTTVGIEWLS